MIPEWVADAERVELQPTSGVAGPLVGIASLVPAASSLLPFLCVAWAASGWDDGITSWRHAIAQGFGWHGSVGDGRLWLRRSAPPHEHEMQGDSRNGAERQPLGPRMPTVDLPQPLTEARSLGFVEQGVEDEHLDNQQDPEPSR